MSKELTTVKEETLDAVSKRIKALQSQGEIHFPPDYSPQNALKSAWLILQNTVDKDKRPVLDVCTKASILNSLMDMVITGLNPAKAQGYFIAYGKQLVFQRSYFGSEALAKRIDPEIEDIIAETVYEGDDFQYEIVRGRKQILKHKQTIKSVNSGKILAAYCMVIDKNGEVKKTELMTFDEIKKAWAKSQMHPLNQDGSIKAGSTHDEFTAEMCRKTVINRTCKPIINSSNDKHLKIAAQRSEVVAAEQEATEQIEYNANQKVIDIESESEPEDPGSEPGKTGEKTESTTRKDVLSPEEEEIRKGFINIKKRETLVGTEKLLRKDMPYWSSELKKEWGDKWFRTMRQEYQFQEPEPPGEETEERVKENGKGNEPPVKIKCSRKGGQLVDVEKDCMQCPDREDNEGRIVCPHYQAYMENINGTTEPSTEATAGGGPDF